MTDDPLAALKKALAHPAVIVGFFVLFVLAGLLRGQGRVEAINWTTAPWSGWVRTTVDLPPPVRHGKLDDGTVYHVGRQVGPRAVVVDLRCDLPPRQLQRWDLHRAVPVPPPVLGADELDGAGRPVVGGIELEPAKTSVAGKPNPLPDGAGYVVHWAGRPWRDAPMFHADVWITFYPGQPWANGELVVCASNPAVPDVVATLPVNLDLGWTNGVVLVPKVPAFAPLIPAGETFGDGQARSYRFTVGWPSRIKHEQVPHALADKDCAITALGLRHPGAVHKPAPIGPDYDPALWVARHWDTVQERLLTWQEMPVGVAAASTQTGAQEDQGFFQGSRAYAPGGLGAVTVRYFAALGQSRRPMHHLDEDGTHLDLTGHPELVFWDARPHWHTGVSPDRLGKDGTLSGSKAHRWWGPDRQHWFINSLSFAAQATGSPALQWQLEAHVGVFIYQETVDPRLSTSGVGAARAQGWAGLVAANLFVTAEDRTKADAVRDRWKERCERVYMPFWTGNAWQLWDVQQDPRVMQYVDPALYPNVSMLYQTGLGTMGVEIAGQRFQQPEVREQAYRQALKVVEHAYDAELVEWEIVGIKPNGDLADELVEGVSAHRTGWYRSAWLPCASWVVLQHDPDHQKALAIYERATQGHFPHPWMPPR